METQNIQPDSRGHFSARLGSASGHGLPADLFASGEARWLGDQVQGQA
jgi:trimeric autotransporter adhesin